MECPKCAAEFPQKYGKTKSGNQRYRCSECGTSFVEARDQTLGQMRLPVEIAVKCLKLLLDGMSIRAVERFTGVNRTTICDLIVQVGENCRELMNYKLANVQCRDLQVDEVWSFVGCKEKTKVQNDYAEDMGDAYAYVALERDTKLIVACQVGKRTDDDTRDFIEHLRSVTARSRFQINTDGWSPYRTAIPVHFGHSADHGVIIKTFATPNLEARRRYSPPAIVKTSRDVAWGKPDPARISTSHVERSNLTLRMTLRRWTRLTNAHSKSWRHHEAALALYICFYNWCRPHTSLDGDTPAMTHGLTDHRWTMEELLTQAARA